MKRQADDRLLAAGKPRPSACVPRNIGRPARLHADATSVENALFWEILVEFIPYFLKSKRNGLDLAEYFSQISFVVWIALFHEIGQRGRADQEQLCKFDDRLVDTHKALTL